MRELALPVLFNLLRSSSGDASDILWHSNILPDLLALLADQSWCVDACVCLGRWLAADSTGRVKHDVLQPDNTARLAGALCVHRDALIFPKLLAAYTSLAQCDTELATALVGRGLVQDVLRFVDGEKKPFTRVALLRLMRALYKNARVGSIDAAAAQHDAATLQRIVEHDTSAMVKNITNEIVACISAHTAQAH